jgi:acyl-coenzyme A synthetase/AMP-(fatty) acid ligase/acyl carrier protein
MLDSGLEIGLELPLLHWWFTSGEPLSDSLVERFASFVPEARLVNLYGSSEVAGDVTFGQVEPGRCDIGRPIANTTVRILDEHLTPVPIGVPGRIYVGGANLARGYHDQPAQTAASFVPDPVSDLPGVRLYDTGDRGRWRRNGCIEFLGRRDHQVKVRGYRVELGHVERSLREHPEVVDAVVALVRLNEYNERLTAFVQSTATIDELRSHARRILPEFMVPGAFVNVDVMPRKPNGKLDRSALSAIATPAVREPRHIAPTTDVQRHLAQMWTELLGIQRVSIDDNFFELGGHSLLATRLVSLVRDRLDVEVRLATIFERAVLRDMANEIERVATGFGPAGSAPSSTAKAPA